MRKVHIERKSREGKYEYLDENEENYWRNDWGWHYLENVPEGHVQDLILLTAPRGVFLWAEVYLGEPLCFVIPACSICEESDGIE